MRRFLVLLLLSWWFVILPVWATDSIIFGGNAGNDPSTTATNYASLSAKAFSIAWNATESNVQQLSSPAGSFKNLYVEITTAPGASKSYAFAVMVNGAATALTCTISDSATTCSDTVNTGAVTAGQKISLRSVPSGTPGATGVMRWSVRLASTTTSETGFNLNTSLSDATLYNAPQSGQAGFSTTEAIGQQVMPTGGTLKNLYVLFDRSPANGGGTQTYTFAVMVNGVASGITCAISENGTTCNDTTNTKAVVAGDLVDVRSVASGTPRTVVAAIGQTMLTTTTGDYVITDVTDTNLSTSATNYLPVSSGGTAPTATEGNVLNGGEAITIKNIYVVNGTAPAGGASYAYSLRVNSANSSPSLTCTVSGVGTTCNAAATVTTSNFNDLDTSIVPASTPTASRVAISYLGSTAAVAASRRLILISEEEPCDWLWPLQSCSSLN